MASSGFDNEDDNGTRVASSTPATADGDTSLDLFKNISTSTTADVDASSLDIFRYINSSTSAFGDGGSLDLFQYSSSTTPLLLLLVCIISAVIFTGDLVVCLAMRRARNIHFSTKWYTCLSLGLDCVFVLDISAVIVLRTLGINDPVFSTTMILIVRLVLSLSWVTISLLLMDKAVCFYKPNEYIINAEPKKIVLFTIVVFTAVVGLKMSSRVGLLPWMNEEPVTLDTLRNEGPILTWILGLSLLVDFICYMAIYRVVHRHVRRTAALNYPANQTRSFSSASSIVAIFFVFLAIHLPLFALLLYGDIRGTTNGHNYGTLVAMLIVCCANPVVYAWRFREVRFICLQFLASLCPMLGSKTEAMRLRIYDIVSSKYSSQLGPPMPNGYSA